MGRYGNPNKGLLKRMLEVIYKHGQDQSYDADWLTAHVALTDFWKNSTARSTERTVNSYLSQYPDIFSRVGSNNYRLTNDYLRPIETPRATDNTIPTDDTDRLHLEKKTLDRLPQVRDSTGPRVEDDEAQIVAIIHKIKFGKETDVYPHNYLNVYSQRDRWNSSSEFKSVSGRQFKLLLYDTERKELTVQVEVEKIEQTNSEPGFSWSNIFAPDTWRELNPPIPVAQIDLIGGLSNFSKGRTAQWKLTASQYEALFAKPTDWQIDSTVEGYLSERKYLCHSRNRAIVEKRKREVNFTCQVCDFRLEVNGKFIIDVHHLDPFRLTDERITSIDDIVCLCPNCHRIADSRQLPYSLDEIREIRRTINYRDSET